MITIDTTAFTVLVSTHFLTAPSVLNEVNDTEAFYELNHLLNGFMPFDAASVVFDRKNLIMTVIRKENKARTYTIKPAAASNIDPREKNGIAGKYVWL